MGRGGPLGHLKLLQRRKILVQNCKKAHSAQILVSNMFLEYEFLCKYYLYISCKTEMRDHLQFHKRGMAFLGKISFHF